MEWWLFWLLLPVAAWSGYLLGIRGSARSSDRRFSQLSRSYFRGLNYLLNEQPDKAIEVFLKIAETDSGTFETQLALGNLFRRRGEVDRAIRLHQDLYSRPKLSKEQRTVALIELGEDYMRAGLLDRAESLYNELVTGDGQAPTALRHLISIYQQERDWTRAVEMARRLEQASGESMGAQIAQFQCEQAEEARQAQDLERAMLAVRQALESDPRCVRALLLQARLLRRSGQLAEAAMAFETAARIDPDFLTEIVGELMAVYEQLGDCRRAHGFLEELMPRDRGVTTLLARGALIERDEGRPAAIEFLAGHLHQRPSVRGVKRIVDLSFPEESGARGEAVGLIRDLLTRLHEHKPGYRCSRCGYSPRSLHWQCPSCKSWGSIKPVQGLAGE